MTFIPTSQITRSIDHADATKPGRLPGWFRINIHRGERYKTIRQIIDTHGLHTICEEARCPNQWECWNQGTATFLILGDICSRRCGYCSVTTGRPRPIDRDEPRRIGETVRLLALRHAVITSVNRDELPDGGASIFAETIASIRRLLPTCTVEVLIPDFQGSWKALDTVMQAAPDILNHNIETVPRLFPAIRPQGKYPRSLELLDRARVTGVRTKSGLMVGLGESVEEIRAVMQDLRKVKCQILTIGQYLRPTKNHTSVARYYQPEEFEGLKEEAENLGFAHVESGPLVRSSYHAEKQARRSGLSPENNLT